MSDSSTESRRSGSGGQRRSGNSNRRNNRNRNRNRNREGGGGGGGGGGRGGQQQGRRPSSSRRPPREPKPIPLTWWQKILKALGLYKEPVRPPRKRKDPSAETTQPAKKAPKSGTRVAKTAEGNREAPKSKPKPVDSTRLYLGNLSYDASEYDLEDLFKGVGAVRNVEIVYNRNTHKSKGYGFIEMATIDEAKRAVEVLHDQPFMGRKLIVSGAKSKGPADDDRDADGGNDDGDRGDDAGGDSEENS